MNESPAPLGHNGPPHAHDLSASGLTNSAPEIGAVLFAIVIAREKEYRRAWRDKEKRLKRGELECPRLRWVPKADRQDMVDAGFLDPDDIDDPDAVSAAREAILAMVRKNIRRRV